MPLTVSNAKLSLNEKCYSSLIVKEFLCCRKMHYFKQKYEMKKRPSHINYRVYVVVWRVVKLSVVALKSNSPQAMFWHFATINTIFDVYRNQLVSHSVKRREHFIQKQKTNWEKILWNVLIHTITIGTNTNVITTMVKIVWWIDKRAPHPCPLWIDVNKIQNTIQSQKNQKNKKNVDGLLRWCRLQDWGHALFRCVCTERGGGVGQLYETVHRTNCPVHGNIFPMECGVSLDIANRWVIHGIHLPRIEIFTEETYFSISISIALRERHTSWHTTQFSASGIDCLWHGHFLLYPGLGHIVQSWVHNYHVLTICHNHTNEPTTLRYHVDIFLLGITYNWVRWRAYFIQ